MVSTQSGWPASKLSAQHLDQSVAVLVRNDQEICRTLHAHTDNLCTNENLVISPITYSGSSTIAIVQTHISLTYATKDGGGVQFLSCAMHCVGFS